MPTFYSPAGNPEEWESKPAGYLSVAEWQEAQQASLVFTLDEALKIKIRSIMSGYSSSFVSVEAIYPSAEREGWAIQEAEAKAALADPSSDTPVLSALVALRARGETLAELAQKVLDNAANWRALYACLTGQQQRMYAEVTALAAREGATAADILEYEVSYAAQ